VYLGVNKVVLKAGLNSTYRIKKFYIREPEKLQILKKRMKVITSPFTILRHPGPFSKITDWKRSV